jgi:hypothetical protein
VKAVSFLLVVGQMRTNVELVRWPALVTPLSSLGLQARDDAL